MPGELTGCGSAVPVVQAWVAGSYTAKLLIALPSGSNPPITYSLPSRNAARGSYRACGRSGSRVHVAATGSSRQPARSSPDVVTPPTAYTVPSGAVAAAALVTATG